MLTLAPGVTRRQLLAALGNTALAAGGGALCALALPPFEWWGLAWVGVAPLLIALRGAERLTARAGLGLVFGMVFAGLALAWLQTIFGPSTPGIIALVALPWAAFGALYGWLARRTPPVALWLLTPALWVAIEWLRCEGWYFRFSWLQLGVAHVPWRQAWHVYSVAGVYGFTVLSVLAGAALAYLVVDRPPWRVRLGLTGLALALLALSFALPVAPSALPADTRVLLVQNESGDAETIQRLTLAHEARGADLVVWPEYAVIDYPRERPPLMADLQQTARRMRGVLVIGTKEAAPAHAPVDWLRRRGMLASEGRLFYNTALLLGPDGGELGAYHKRHPIQLFADGVPGEGHPTFDTPAGRLGLAICYDFDYVATARRLAHHGADLLVVPTFDSEEWTPLEHAQHGRIAQARAAEVGRWVARATSSGESQLINPHGQVEAVIPDGFVRGVNGRVGRVSAMTPYARAGWLLPFLCLAVAAAWVVVVLLPRRTVQSDSLA